MYLTKKFVSRRAVLRSVGVGVALPLLDAMIPAQTPLRKTAGAPTPRLSCIEMVHGAAGSTQVGAHEHYWSPRQEGANFEFSYTLEPLSPFREYLTIITNTDARSAETQAPVEAGADHFRSSAAFLTAAHARQGPEIGNGTSIDQIYAQRSAVHTRLPSLPLCIENIGLNGSCGFNYSCVYADTICWASPTEPIAMAVNPRTVFETLFGTAKNSVLDGAAPDAARLSGSIGPSDRARLDAHLTEIRAVERRIQATEKANAKLVARARPGAPLGVPESWEEHVKLMFDMQVIAFAAEITRVSALKMSRDTSNRVFDASGVKIPFHTLSHHIEDPALIAEFAKLNRYHVGMLPYFLEKLRTTPDGDGNLLDHSLVLYGSPMGDSNTHNHRRLPMLIAGHACGSVKGNLHRICTDGTPHGNTLLTILKKLDVEIESVGDSNGTIAI
jgi:hypothetical protein